MMKRKAADALDELRRLFDVSADRQRTMITAFHDEMARGLAGSPSSLQMLPTYIDNPTGLERGTFLALDMGGTNARVLRADLRGDGSAPAPISRKFPLNRDQIASTGDVLFAAVARLIGRFLAEHGLDGGYRMGFTFSFAIRQRSIDRGELIAWTKGWTATGVAGEDVVEFLNRSLSREGLTGVRVVSLNNDTTGTHMARAYLDPACDAACILGTGTNACYRERVANIRKPIGPYGRASMIINMESGNFDKALPRNPFDALLDARSENPGAQSAEKMVSGKYLGELVRLIVADFGGRGALFDGRLPEVFAVREGFGSERVCEIKEDGTTDATSVRALLADLGAGTVVEEDARALREIAWIVSDRAARIAASILAATVTKNDPALDRDHTIAVDGSVFEKHPGFRVRMEETFRELYGDRGARIRLELTRDGSGLGAAIIAAVASGPGPKAKE
jgi:hexokinase